MATVQKPRPVPNPPSPAPPKRKPKLFRLKNVLILIVIVALAACAGYFAYKYDQSKKEITTLSDPKVAAAQQVADLVNQVGKLAQLPSGEKPTVATVTDITKLKGQAFFTSAQNGDKVLIFTSAKRAYLYRPSENKVIEIAPLNIGNGQPAATSDTTQSSTPSQ